MESRSTETKKEYLGYQKKKEPTTLSTVLDESSSLDAFYIQFNRKIQLERVLHQLPLCASDAPYARTYGELGLFGKVKAVNNEVCHLAQNREPHVIDHLKVMDQIKSRSLKN